MSWNLPWPEPLFSLGGFRAMVGGTAWPAIGQLVQQGLTSVREPQRQLGSALGRRRLPAKDGGAVVRPLNRMIV